MEDTISIAIETLKRTKQSVEDFFVDELGYESAIAEVYAVGGGEVTYKVRCWEPRASRYDYKVIFIYGETTRNLFDQAEKLPNQKERELLKVTKTLASLEGMGEHIQNAHLLEIVEAVTAPLKDLRKMLTEEPKREKADKWD